MKAYELAEILLRNPNADVKQSVSDTESPLGMVKDMEKDNIEFENVRNQEIIYLNYDFPIS